MRIGVLRGGTIARGSCGLIGGHREGGRAQGVVAQSRLERLLKATTFPGRWRTEATGNRNVGRADWKQYFPKFGVSWREVA